MTNEKRPFPKEIDRFIFPICEKFFAQKRENRKNTEDIAEWVRGELKKAGKKVSFSRQQIYPVIAEAIRLGYVRYFPPLSTQMTQRIADLTHTKRECISVVETSGDEEMDQLAAVASEILLDLIREVAKKDPECKGVVHLGLGAGGTTMLVAKHLGLRLRTIGKIPGVSKLVLHAISSGFLVERPELSPIAFFNFFADSTVRVDYVGLFSEAVVSFSEWEDWKKGPGIGTSFERRTEIQIVATSLAGKDHEHGILNQFEKLYNLKKKDRVGNVQFRPYDAQGPIEDKRGDMRAVTLFELSDFVCMTQEEGKFLLLIAGPVDKEGKTQADALMPLLTQPSLRVWSHLCTNVQTAQEIVARLEA